MVALVGERVRLLGDPSSVMRSAVCTLLGAPGVLGTPTPRAPVREPRQAFGDTEYVNIPLNVPWVPGGTMIQPGSLTPVVQMQFAPTWTVPLPPPAGKLMVAGVTV